METKRLQPWAAEAWRLTRRQHGVVTRRQLLALGMPAGAIRSRLEAGRLHRLWAGIYAVGRPDVGQLGRFKAATLACGRDAQLSHRSAAALWGIRPVSGRPIDVVVRSGFHRRLGIRLHRRVVLGRPRFVRDIAVDEPISVLVDIALELPDEELEDAVNEADRRDVVATPRLRAALDSDPIRGRRGAGRLRHLLDAQTFSRSQNALERRFYSLVREAHLPTPNTQQRLGRHRVDFFWPDFGLVVETDSLTHHRTAAEQAVDIGRDHAHVRRGLRTVRFTHSQVFHRPEYVRAVLEETVRHIE